MSKELCKDCKHYVESTDYCEQNQFELEEKVIEDCPHSEPDEEWIEGCIYYGWDGER